jgi:hypothetical protein
MDAAPPENDEQLEAVVSSANGADAAAFDHAGAVAALGGDVARAIGMLAERARSEARSEVEREELYKTAKTLGLAKYIELRLAVIAASVGERMPPPPDATPELVAELVRRRVALIMRMRRYYVTLGAILFRGFAAALKAAKRAAPAPAHGAATKKRVKESAVAHGGGAAAAPACAKKAKKAAGAGKVKTRVRVEASVGDAEAGDGIEDDDGSDSDTESESAPAAHAASTSGAAKAVKSRAAFSDLKGCVYAPAKAVIAVQASASSSVDLDDGVALYGLKRGETVALNGEQDALVRTVTVVAGSVRLFWAVRPSEKFDLKPGALFLTRGAPLTIAATAMETVVATHAGPAGLVGPT